MKKLFCIAVSLIMVFFVLAACSDNGSSKDLTTIETSVCDLKFPSKWEKTVDVDVLDQKTETVRFSMDGVSIFDISFGNGDTLLGTLKKGEETTDVYVLLYELDKKDKNYETYAKVQDDVNVITENLAKDYEFKAGAPLLEDNGETFEIKTSLCPMRYPKRWEDRVTIKAEEKQVSFSCDDTPLFTLYFGGDKGELLGKYDGTELRLYTDKLDSEKLTAKQITEYGAMQEDVNVILQGLYDDKKFEVAF